MRFLRYFVLLLVASLSLSITAQDRKVVIKYMLGDNAIVANYKLMFDSTYIYTFISNNDAREAIKGLAEGKGNFNLQADFVKQGRFFNDYYLLKENIKLESDTTVWGYSENYINGYSTDSTKVIKYREVSFILNTSSEVKYVAMFTPNGAPRDKASGAIIYEDNEESLGVYSTLIKTVSPTINFEIKTKEAVIIDVRPDNLPTPIAPKPAEELGKLYSRNTYKIPYRVKPNYRIVAQPVWYDRIDVADEESDTVFAYGKPVYLDCGEFALTQNRAMDYNMSNDKLYSYVDTLEYHYFISPNVYRIDSLWYEVRKKVVKASVVPTDRDNLLRVFPKDKKLFKRSDWLSLFSDSVACDSLRNVYIGFLAADTASSSRSIYSHLIDTVRNRIALSSNRDTIFVETYEVLTGHDPDAFHPYPSGLLLAVEDYNTTYISDTEKYKDNGERRSPWKFLDYAYRQYLPDSATFYVKMKDHSYGRSDELRLKYKQGRDILEKDTINDIQLEKLRVTFESVIDEANGTIDTIFITGQASPEGRRHRNLLLAEQRAVDAIRRIRQITSQGRIPPCKLVVAPWDSVVKIARAEGQNEIADYIQSVIEQHPNDNTEKHWNIISSRYSAKELEPYLSPLRTVYYKYTVNVRGQLPADKILEKYNGGIDSISSFNRGEYFVLLNHLDNMKEREKVASLALERTRDTGDEIAMQNHDGYWVYAAVHLASSYIARNNYDLSVLEKFIDVDAIPMAQKDTIVLDYKSPEIINYENFRKSGFVLDSNGTYRISANNSDTGETETMYLSAGSVEEILSYLNRGEDPRKNNNLIKYPVLNSYRDSVSFYGSSSDEMYIQRSVTPDEDTIRFKKGEYMFKDEPIKDIETGNVRAYMNAPVVAANQLIMAIKNPGSRWAEDIWMLKGIIEQDKEHRYDTLAAIASCVTGNIKNNDAKTMEQRRIVEGTSAINKVILNLFLDDTEIKGGKELDIALETSRLLPDNSEANYLKAIIYNRKNDEEPGNDDYALSVAQNYLARSFSQDISKIYIASNDYELLSGNGEIVDIALTSWERGRIMAIDSTALSEADIAFLNYKTAISELDKSKRARSMSKARLAMYKALILDANYYNIISVRMKGLQKGLKKSKSGKEHLLEGLKEIRHSYYEAVTGKQDATYIKALKEVEDLKKRFK